MWAPPTPARALPAPDPAFGTRYFFGNLRLPARSGIQGVGTARVFSEPPGPPMSTTPRIPASLQELAPAQARFCLGVSRFVKRELGLDIRGASLLVAFSGGADSTALLLALRYLAPSLHLKLAAAHLDHGLRPSSDKEAYFCRAFCDELGITFVSERRDVAAQRRHNKTGIEEEGRSARYDFFARTAARMESDWIATGHQNNDLAEDMLMRLIRGAGWPALSGMPAMDPERRLLRPLLLTPRRDIEDFLASLGLTWLQDESNDDRAYLRNRIRLDLLPLVLRENPAFLNNAAGLWRLGRIDKDYFDALLPSPETLPEPEKALAPEGGADPAPEIADRSGSGPVPTLVMRQEQLAALPKALRLRFYRKTLTRLGPGQPLLPLLLALDRAWMNGGEKTTHRFPGGKTAVVDKKSIFWKKE